MAGRFVRRIYRLFKKIGFFGYSKKRNIFGVHPILVSTVFIIFSTLLSFLLRKIIKLCIPDNIFRSILLEIIATFELCAACFELIIVADNWGVWMYALYLFLLTIWWEFSWETETACPYSPIEEVVEGERDIENAALLIFSQILGALATFTYVQVLWAMELVETHKGRAFEKCTADLQVNMFIGAVIEAVGTYVCRVIARILSGSEAKFRSIVSSFFSTMMVVAAFNYSGGYFNPALATSLKLGCQGNTFVEHVTVYWLGATLGAIIALYTYKSESVQSYVNNIKAKTE